MGDARRRTLVGERHERFKSVAACVLLAILIGADIGIFLVTLLDKWTHQ
jgi:hypothetical protein